jgi:hypothetical protein
VATFLARADILLLSETWLRPGELCAIELLLKSHPLLCDTDFQVFAKSSMEKHTPYLLAQGFPALKKANRHVQRLMPDWMELKLAIWALIRSAQEGNRATYALLSASPLSFL